MTSPQQCLTLGSRSNRESGAAPVRAATRACALPPPRCSAGARPPCPAARAAAPTPPCGPPWRRARPPLRSPPPSARPWLCGVNGESERENGEKSQPWVPRLGERRQQWSAHSLRECPAECLQGSLHITLCGHVRGWPGPAHRMTSHSSHTDAPSRPCVTGMTETSVMVSSAMPWRSSQCSRSCRRMCSDSWLPITAARPFLRTHCCGVSITLCAVVPPPGLYGVVGTGWLWDVSTLCAVVPPPGLYGVVGTGWLWDVSTLCAVVPPPRLYGTHLRHGVARVDVHGAQPLRQPHAPREPASQLPRPSVKRELEVAGDGHGAQQPEVSA
jgi:hypothetical protein